jgi:myxalamid-type polyketide synthase MxaE and MxaD
VDLGPVGGAGEADSLLEELGREDEEEQVALRGGARYVARLSQRPVEVTPPPSLVPAATYWITGGLGGIGLRIARWMVERGARHLVLTGRSEPGEEAQRELEAMRAAGAEVRILHADVAQADQAARVVGEIEREMPPLRGLVHAAGTSDELSLLAMTVERLRQVMAPKVAGAWNLHVLTREKPLDFFVLCSSAIALLGSPGVGNYAAGNAFLDALAHERRRAGLPALTINWGIWGGVGLAAVLGDRLSARGLGSLSSDEGLEALSRALSQPAPRVAVMRFSARQWREFFLSAASSPFLSQLQAAKASQPRAEGSIRQELLQRAPAERRAVLEQHIREQIARVLQTAVTRVGLRTPFMQLGVDSLMAMEIPNRLEASLGMTLKVTLIWKHPTVSDLVTQLGREFGLPESAVPGTPPDAVKNPVAPAVGAVKAEASPGQTAERISQVLNLLKARKSAGTPGDGSKV